MTSEAPGEKGSGGRSFSLQGDYSVLFVVAIILIASLGCLFVAQAFTQRPIHLVNPFFLGYDFHDFFVGGQAIAHHQNPYDASRYVTPPLPALITSPMSGMNFADVAPYVCAASVASVVLGIVLFVFALKRENKWPLILAAVALTSVGFPFCFLIDRGNIDGFVFLFVGLFAFFLSRKQPWLAGIALGLGACLKVYPLLLLAPLLLRRQYKAAGAVVLTLLASVAVQPGLWLAYVPNLFTRVSGFRTDENGSVAVVLKLLLFPFSEQNNRLLSVALLGVVAIVLIRCLQLDRKRNIPDVDLIVEYLPFMMAIPAVVYLYSFVNIVPVLFLLSRRMWFATVGYALTQFNAVAWQQATGTTALHVLPSLGLVMIIGALLMEKTRAAQAFEGSESGPSER